MELNKFKNEKLLRVSTIKNEEEREKAYLHINSLTNTEDINYAEYTVDREVIIEKYIPQDDILYSLFKHEKSLLLAETGSGKTYSLLTMLIKNENLLGEKKFCFVVPGATQCEQITRQYDIKGAWGNINQNEVFELNKISCYTWDKFSKISDLDKLKNTIVAFDEKHQVFSDLYRKKVIEKMLYKSKYCFKRIDITATPSKIIFDHDYILKYTPETKTDYRIKLYEKIDEIKIVEIINNSIKCSIFRDDISFLQALSSKINKKSELICSANKKNNDTYKEIVQKSNIKNIDIMLNTSVIVAGVNINEEDITDIILIDVKDISIVKQYIARFRGLKKLNVHIFNNYVNFSYVDNIENQITENINSIEMCCNHFNSLKQKNKLDSNLLFKSLLHSMKIKMEDGVFKVDDLIIRSEIYENYYVNADIISFCSLIKEYFSNVEIIKNEVQDDNDLKELQKQQRQDAKEHLIELKKHKDVLINYEKIVEGTHSKYLEEHIIKNVLDTHKKHPEILNMLKKPLVKKSINLFENYVVEKTYTYNLAYTLSTMSKQEKSEFFSRLDVIFFRKINENLSEFIDRNSPDIILYDFIYKTFYIDFIFDKQTINNLCKKLLEFKIEINERQLRTYIRSIFEIEPIAQRRKKKEELKDGETAHVREYKIIGFYDMNKIYDLYDFDEKDKYFLENRMSDKFTATMTQAKKIHKMISVLEK